LSSLREPTRGTGRREQGSSRGGSLVEFALVVSLIFVPMLAGLASVGMSMVMAMQAANLNATAGQMFSTGIDFTQASNQTMLQTTVAGGLNTISSAGGVVILSEIDGTGTGATCSTPILISLGTGAPVGKTSQCANVVAAMTPSLGAGQSIYLAETYYNNPLFTWVFAPAGTGTGIYVKAVF
jgi:hypothetical protein